MLDFYAMSTDNPHFGQTSEQLLQQVNTLTMQRIHAPYKEEIDQQAHRLSLGEKELGLSSREQYAMSVIFPGTIDIAHLPKIISEISLMIGTPINFTDPESRKRIKIMLLSDRTINEDSYSIVGQLSDDAVFDAFRSCLRNPTSVIAVNAVIHDGEDTSHAGINQHTQFAIHIDNSEETRNNAGFMLANTLSWSEALVQWILDHHTNAGDFTNLDLQKAAHTLNTLAHQENTRIDQIMNTVRRFASRITCSN